MTDERSPLVSMLDPDKAYVQSAAVHELFDQGLMNQFRTEYSATLSADVRAEVKQRIDAVCEELEEDARQGYPVRPVHALTRGHARVFLRRLPSWVPDPDVGVDPNGDLTLEWYTGRDHVLSISLAPSGEVVYAYANGRRRESGCDDVKAGIPGNLMELLRSFE